jgi:hypothetical protein
VENVNTLIADEKVVSLFGLESATATSVAPSSLTAVACARFVSL